MTTADFIARTYNTRNDRWNSRNGYTRYCSSVLTDRNGTVYSYGYHYPLAFHVKGLDFVNEQGYSSTTSKHIAWARRALEYEYIGVKLWRDEAQIIASDWADEGTKLTAILTALERELTGIVLTMNGKKRKDTWVYHDLMAQETRVRDAIAKVKEVQ